ncbi:N-acetylmuramate alpha-1-phosphate uridylyltransferase MurU [Legionella impletisoli]|uniref:Mannose-1-phosphate guanylyltransferase n=1 Tax=Legionella impletisoli TaxID=343510 RepID=A0A917K0M3_9GAMM|nr:nucleotidyltransferase family protein [Legionella impletisoli]GGI93398.1 mannose-1-phosphate guanylyltransferase [Legionella impletisoli]
MKTAMILAAGRGERLKPFTHSLPKALSLVHNTPLIEHHVKNLAKAGYEKIVINHAYLGGMIRQYLGNGERWGLQIEYSPEPPGGLETGGGIVNALPLLGKEPFLVINGDILTNYPFADSAIATPYLAHLVLVKRPKYQSKGDFGLLTTRLVENETQEYTFTGIAYYHPDVFNSLRVGRFSLTPILRQLVQKQQVLGELFEGKWIDIGTPERLAQANQS